MTQLGKLRIRMSSERGATAVEYGLMVLLIALVIVAGVAVIGTNLNALFDTVSGAV